MRVVVAGAGFAGLALAHGLAGAGATVTVAERATVLGVGPVGLTIQPNGLEALDRLGLREVVEACGERCTSLTSHQWDLGMSATAHYRDIDAPFEYLVGALQGDVQRALAGALPPQVEIALGTEVTSATAVGGRWRVELGGRSVDADLLVGAEGANSPTRARVATRTRERRINLAFVMFTVPNTARLPFSTFSFLDKTLLPVIPCGGWRVNVYWGKLATDLAGELDGDVREVTRRIDEVTGLEASTHVTSWEQAWRVPTLREVRCAPWSGPGVALIGDAAHPILPTIGQGANQALQDAEALVRAVARVGPRDAPAAYEGERRGAATAMADRAWIVSRLGEKIPMRLVRPVMRRVARRRSEGGLTANIAMRQIAGQLTYPTGLVDQLRIAGLLPPTRRWTERALASRAFPPASPAAEGHAREGAA